MDATIPAETQRGVIPRSRKALVVFCPHGIGDPLVGPLMLDYVLKLQQRTTAYDVLFFTEEPPNAIEPAGIREVLGQARVKWVPLRYDVTGRQWLQKWRILRTLWSSTRAFVKHYERSWLVGYLSYGGSYAMLGRWLGLGKCAVVCFEPHSRYMVEMGIWGRRSIKALVMDRLERWQMERSDLLVVPTTAVRDLALANGATGRVEMQAITIDVDGGHFDATARSDMRNEWDLGGATVLVYVGKFGGIYHSVDDYMRFVERLSVVDPQLRFFIISQEAELERFRAHRLFPFLSERLVLHPPVPASDLHRYLSVADVGVIAIPPTPSQAYRTPVKTAHYWAAGLPVVIPRGVSDDHRIAEEEHVGIAVDDLPTIDPGPFLNEMRRLLEGDRQQLRERCVATARRYRDSSRMVELLQRSLASD